MPGRRHQRRKVQAQRIGRDHTQALTLRFGHLSHDRDGSVVHLDGGDAGGWGIEQSARQTARTRPDLHHVSASQLAGRPSDAGRQIAVQQEVLTEGTAGVEPVAGNDLPQRGTVGQAPRPRMSILALRRMSRSIWRDSRSRRSATI